MTGQDEKLMKNLLLQIGAALWILLGVIIVLIFIPLIIIAFIIISSAALYENIWKKLRHDPKVNLSIKELGDINWEDAKTADEFVSAFEKYLDVIAGLSSAKQGKLEYDGFEILENPSEEIKWTPLALRKSLRTASHELRFELNFGVSKSKNDKDAVLRLDRLDEECVTPVLPIDFVFVRPQVRRTFTLMSMEGIWMVIGFLRNDTQTTYKGQLYTYIPEHNLFLVQYKNNMNDYGLRSKFYRVSTAHKYRYDKI